MPQLPQQPYYERVNLSPKDWVFKFDNLQNFDRFIEEKKSQAQSLGRTLKENFDFVEKAVPNQANKMNYYGVASVDQLKSNLDKFLYSTELPTLLGNITGRINKLNISDLDQTKGIFFTEKEIGVFSFDLASLGLVPVYEYWSELLKTIVDPNKVKSVLNQVGTRVFFMEEQQLVPQHKVDYNEKFGGFYSNILKRVVQKSELLLLDTDYYYPEKPFVPKHDVERRHKLDEKGKKKYTTTFKKCFIEIKRVDKPLPRVDILVPFSFDDSYSASQLKYNCLSAIKLAENLSKLGINFRMVASYPVSKGGINFYSYIIVKGESEPLDINRLALFIGDPRYYRFQRFRAIISMFSDAGYDSFDVGWTPITNINDIKDKYISYLRQSPKPEEKDAANRPDSKFILQRADSEQAAVDSYENLITQIRNFIT